MKLLIRNLDRTTTEQELNSLFLEIGKVQSCNIVVDRETGGSKGFGFVEMPLAGQAKLAMKKLNNQTVGANKIRVKRAEEKSTKPSGDTE